MNLTIRIPDAIHEELKRYRDEKRPHLSLNALIMEAIVSEIQPPQTTTEEPA